MATFLQDDKDNQPNVCESCLSYMDNRRTEVKEVLLAIAVRSGHDQCVKELIKAGLDLNSGYVTEAFRLSDRRGKHHIMDLLINAGVDVNSRDNFGDTPLIRAASTSQNEETTKRMEQLLKAGAGVNLSNNDGQTALMGAAYHGNAECVKIFTSGGANVNQRNSVNENTALLYAAMKNHCECIRILVQAGADVNMKGKFGNLALTSLMKGPACGDENSRVLYFMIRRSSGLFGFNTLPCIKLLLQHGADVNAIDGDGNTPLLSAIKYSTYDSVVEFIGAGADVNLTPDGRFTPLMVAATKSNERLVRLLLRSGSKINMKKECGQQDGEKLMTLLFAAGQTISGEMTRHELNLNHLCREAIRNHLLEIDPHHHLFDRVPKLRLPSALSAYLLYNMSLDDGDDNDDNN